jgi:hypothetical protein
MSDIGLLDEINKFAIHKYFTPFNISNADITTQKNNKSVKSIVGIFTYDGLTFSSSLFLLEDVKDEI